MSVLLDAEQRRFLQREIDRRTRVKIGEPQPTGSYVTLTEAAQILGIRSSNLRRLTVVLGIETKKTGNRRFVPVESLELLRAVRWG